jgi:glycosyltransferase involved in cell wall biosynthesis
MRVLIAGWQNRDYYGGLEVHIKHVFDELKKNEKYGKMEIFLAYPAFKPETKVKESVIPIPINSARFMDAAAEYSTKLARWIKRNDINVVHTHDWLSIKAGMAVKNRVKWVHTHHSLWFARQFFEHEEDKIKELEFLANNADFVFTVSELMKSECESRELRIDDVVYSGGALEFREEKLPTQSNFLLYAGRLSKSKGVDLLLVSFAKYLNEVGEKKKLIITGEGELKDRIVDLVKMLKLEDHVELMGFVDKRTLEALYVKCAAFIHPAYFEPYGISLIDAARIRKPLICNKKCGALEVIKNANVMDKASIEDLVEALINLDYKKSTSLNVKLASWENVAKAYANTYISLA